MIMLMTYSLNTEEVKMLKAIAIFLFTIGGHKKTYLYLENRLLLYRPESKITDCVKPSGL